MSALTRRAFLEILAAAGAFFAVFRWRRQEVLPFRGEDFGELRWGTWWAEIDSQGTIEWVRNRRPDRVTFGYVTISDRVTVIPYPDGP